MRRNNTVYMRSISFAMRGDGKTAIQKAVDAANVAPIIMTFPVEAEGENKSAVIDVTPTKLPVLVNGSMLSRSLDKVKTRIHARALVLADDHAKIAIVVVDSCMIPREVHDASPIRDSNGSARSDALNGRSIRSNAATGSYSSRSVSSRAAGCTLSASRR